MTKAKANTGRLTPTAVNDSAPEGHMTRLSGSEEGILGMLGFPQRTGFSLLLNWERWDVFDVPFCALPAGNNLEDVN